MNVPRDTCSRCRNPRSMIHEDLDGEALKAEVLRVARRGSVYDLDVEMKAAGRKEGIETTWLGAWKTQEGDQIVFRFFAPQHSEACAPDKSALDAKLRRMASSCDVLVKEIAWHPHSNSGVLTVLWDSVIPMGIEPLGPRSVEAISASIEADETDETPNLTYRRYGA